MPDSPPNRRLSILAFFATSLASRGIGVGCQLLQVPVALAYLGNEAFGLWITLTSIGAILGFSDFGIGLGAQNQIAEAMGKGDRLHARRIFFSSLVFLLGVMTALMAVVPTFLSAPIAGLLRVNDPVLRESAPDVIAILALFWCVNIPLGLGQRLAYGAQVGWLHNASTTIANVLQLTAVILAAHLKTGVLGFFVLTFGSLALTNLVFLLYLLGRLGWLRLTWNHFDRKVLHGLISVGAHFFVQQLAAMMLFTAPPLILSATLGVDAVTPFSLVQRVFSLFLIVSNAYLLPISPAYAEAKAQNDWGWIQRTLFRSLAAVLALTVVPMSFAAIFCRDLIGLWTNHAAEAPPQSLVWLLFAWTAVSALQQPFGYLLSGLSVVRRSTLFSILSTAAALLLTWLLVPQLGASALPLGLLIGFVPIAFLGTAIESFLLLRHKLSAA